jgi:DNA-binding NtrC family response regulator
VLRVASAISATLVDLARVEEAARVAAATLTAARGMGESAVMVDAGLTLARSLVWQARYGDAAGVIASLEPSASPDALIRLLAEAARVEIGLGRPVQALERATAAVLGANADGTAGLIAAANGAAAFVHLAVNDLLAVGQDVARAVRAARAARVPMAALDARLLSAEAARRQSRREQAVALVGRLRTLTPSALPPLARVRLVLLAALLKRPGQTARVVAAHASRTGLAGLALYTPTTHTGRETVRHGADETLEILRTCQLAQDDAAVLARVCATISAQTRALSVAFVAADEGQRLWTVAVDGGRPSLDVARRVLEAGQGVAPHDLGRGAEAGEPVHYGGRCLGILVCRWPMGATVDRARVTALLVTAATAAAPAIAGAIEQRRVSRAAPVEDLLGTSAATADLRRAIARAAPAPFAVLIEGESGSGKELVARALQRRGPRSDRPMCTINCAALPDELIEAELFGHARGAFTGAVAERPGVFEQAHTGTLFLDEVGELSPRAQAKLLRTIQEGEVRRVGENLPRRIDVRLIAATNRDLAGEVAAGRFRLDLLYRLDVIRLRVPPLRERPDDIPVLAEAFWRESTARVGSRATLGVDALVALGRHSWPGNVRELQNVLASLAVRAPRRGVISPDALPPAIRARPADEGGRLAEARRAFEEGFVRAALARAGGRRSQAAADLGLTRQGLAKLLARLSISRADVL